MAKSQNQKLKLLYLQRILLEKTDENHTLTLADIIAELDKLGIKAERKSIYDDLETLRTFGLDVEARKGKNYGYYVANRQFEMPELKLLVDAVQCSKFITHKKTGVLIKKLETFASQYESQLLQRQVYVSNRVKTENKNIYYNIDNIHAAISEGSQIKFQYYEWTVEKKEKLRREGKPYEISPWALTWDDENYYMIGYDAGAEMIKHYRVDKMTNITITHTKREGAQYFKNFDIGLYMKTKFGMFGGYEQQVTLQFANRLIGVVIDRFGKDTPITRINADQFSITVKVAVSAQFLAWLFGFGTDVKVLAPENVAKQMQQMCESIAKQYS